MTDLNAKKRADEPPNRSATPPRSEATGISARFRRRARAEMPESLETECGSTRKAA
jgi:hypothetical protein